MNFNYFVIFLKYNLYTHQDYTSKKCQRHPDICPLPLTF